MKKILTLSLIVLNFLTFHLKSIEQTPNINNQAIQQSTYEALNEDTKILTKEVNKLVSTPETSIKPQNNSMMTNILIGIGGFLGGLIAGLYTGMYFLFLTITKK